MSRPARHGGLGVGSSRCLMVAFGSRRPRSRSPGINPVPPPRWPNCSRRWIGCSAAAGDPRLTINPATGLNEYGCQPSPCPDTLSFSSSTATSISQRAYDRARKAREALMQSAIAVGIEAAFDARIEAMRDELKACLGLSRRRPMLCFRRRAPTRSFRRCS